MRNKPPAFQFYPDSWLSSPDILVMTPEQENAYHRLLCYAWLSDDCGIPCDDDKLAVMAKVPVERWVNGCSTVVLRKFKKKGERLFNDRLLEERKKQDDFRKKASRAGRASGKARYNRRIDIERLLNEPSTNEERTPNSSSPSSSPSPYKEKIPKGILLETVVSNYNEICISLPRASVTETRKQKFKRQLIKYNDISHWNSVFSKAEASDFLSGRDGAWTSCGFDWFKSEGNRTKVLEGNYDNRDKEPKREYPDYTPPGMEEE